MSTQIRITGSSLMQAVSKTLKVDTNYYTLLMKHMYSFTVWKRVCVCVREREREREGGRERERKQ